MDNIQRYSLLLLKSIADLGAVDIYTAATMAILQRSLSDSAQSDRMTKRNLDALETQGYIKRGAMEGHSYTWYITQVGRNLLSSI